MHLLNNSRLAWTIALSSLALWLGGAPISWGDARLAGVQQVAQSEDASAAATMVDVQVGDASVVGSGDAQPSPQCPVLPPAIAQVVPPSADPGPPPPARDGTFHICGADPQAERTIEQLIAGRGFNATLSARGDGCADLTLHVTSGAVSGSSTSTVSVSLGSGRTLSMHLVSEQGVTHASIVAR